MQVFRVAAIGSASWDRLLVADHYPAAGAYTHVRTISEQPGGTTANIVAALARLGHRTTLAAMVGDDAPGRHIRDDLTARGVDTRYVWERIGEPTDSATIVVSGGAVPERTIFWRRGARLRRGDFLPIEELFAHDLVVVDLDDAGLRRFIVDLPMHVAPRTRLLGPLTYLTELDPEEALDLALRHDYVVGNERELRHIAGTDDLDQAIARFQDEMHLSQCRFAVISRGAQGCLVIDRESVCAVPGYTVDVVDPTGAGDAFAAGVALGILERWDARRLGQVANALGALATRGLGAQATLPDRDELAAFMEATPLSELDR